MRSAAKCTFSVTKSLRRDRLFTHPVPVSSLTTVITGPFLVGAPRSVSYIFHALLGMPQTELNPRGILHLEGCCLGGALVGDKRWHGQSTRWTSNLTYFFCSKDATCWRGKRASCLYCTTYLPSSWRKTLSSHHQRWFASTRLVVGRTKSSCPRGSGGKKAKRRLMLPAAGFVPGNEMEQKLQKHREACK